MTRYLWESLSRNSNPICGQSCYVFSRARIDIDDEFDLFEGIDQKMVRIDFLRFAEDHEASDSLVRQGRCYWGLCHITNKK